MYYISCTHFRHGSHKVSLCIIKENGPFSECPIMTIAEKTRQLDPIFFAFSSLRFNEYCEWKFEIRYYSGAII